MKKQRGEWPVQFEMKKPRRVLWLMRTSALCTLRKGLCLIKWPEKWLSTVCLMEAAEILVSGLAQTSAT